MAVQGLEQIKQCQVDLASGTLTVWYTGDELNLPGISQAVQSAGYTLMPGRPARQERLTIGFARFLLARQSTTLTAAAGVVTLLGLTSWLAGWDAAATLLFVAAILLGGIPLAQKAWQELTRSRSLGINTLMVIAVTGAGIIGEWAEAAIVVVLFSLGEAMEGFAADRARAALDSLLDLAPPMAHRRSPSGEFLPVSVEQLAVGDHVLVRPGDRVTVDGVVHSGRSAVDQSPITGESVPVEKAPGDAVFAGTVNGQGALEVEVSRPAADNTLNRMVALIRQAQSHRAPVQRFVDRFARVYTPAVAAVAVLVAAVPPLLFGQSFWGDRGWLMRALEMLVIACPCALVISTPVSVVSAMTGAAARGVLIKGGRHLDALGRVQAVAFDKTGTLTQGMPIATDLLHVCTCGDCHENCGLQYAASLEAQSSHPLARALLAAAEERQLALSPAKDVTVLTGRGLEGTVNGATVTVANHAHFDQHFPHREDICQEAEALAQQGKTVMLVQHGNLVCGLFAVADTPRAESRTALAAIKAQGIHVIMLTGDHAAVAKAIGEQVGVDEVLADLLPEDKMRAIADLTARYGSVAMVGDGVNDAPALAQAEVGIAMGGAGSHQAMETADVVLMGDDLNQLPTMLSLGRRTRRLITTNIVFALAVKVAVFALAAAGLATLWMAVVADVGASLAVIVNGMRLRTAQ